MAAWRIAIWVSLLALTAAPAQGNDDALRLTPSGSWTAEFADDSCAVRRSFENGGDRVFLEFRSFAPEPTINASIASDTLALWLRKPKTGFRPSADEVKAQENYRALKTDNGWRGVVLTESSAEPNDAWTDYLVQGVFRQDVELVTGHVNEVAKIMRRCEDDLLASLGLDARANRTLSRRVELTGHEKWLSVTAPMQRDFTGRGSDYQKVRLLVDEQGKVFACRIVVGSNDESIEKRMCDVLLEKAQFQPALDANSQPVKSFYLLELSAMRRS